MSSWYPVPENPTHGIFVQRHARAVSLLHDVAVIYCTGTERENEKDLNTESKEFSEYIRFYYKKGKSPIGKLLALRTLYKQAFEQLVKVWGKPDIIHLNVIFPAGLFALKLAEANKIPLVITEHWTGYLPEDGSYQGMIKRYFTKRITSAASAICPVTKHLATAMQSHGLRGNYFIVPNVVDTASFTPSAKNEQGHTIFLHLSSFDERQKNPKSIIDAFKKVYGTNPSTSLIMAGDGENIGELKEYAGNHPAIRFYFRPTGDDVVRLYQKSDVIVLNSNYENLPVVLLEAMSCGLPVISSNVGGIGEYVDDKIGILFSPPSVNALTDAMLRFISRKEQFNSAFIRESAVRYFSRPQIAQAYSDIYKKVLC